MLICQPSVYSRLSRSVYRRITNRGNSDPRQEQPDGYRFYRDLRRTLVVDFCPHSKGAAINPIQTFV
jgi:hypothetical protein